LLSGRAVGERGMYVTLSETAEELRSTAESHGWVLDGIDVIELNELQPRVDEAYTLFHPSEVELQETVEIILRASKKSLRPASSWIRCRRCDCSREIRFAFAGRFSA
jgi:circadian clock protein KaiC